MGNTDGKHNNPADNVPSPLGNIVHALTSFGIRPQPEFDLPDNIILKILGTSPLTFRLARTLNRRWYQLSFTGSLVEFYQAALVRVNIPTMIGLVKEIRCEMIDTIAHVHSLVQQSGEFGSELDIKDAGYFFVPQNDMDGKWLDFKATIKESKIGWSPYLEYKSKRRILTVNVATIWKSVEINDSDTVADITKTVCKTFKLPHPFFSLYIPKGIINILLQEKKTLHSQDWEISESDELALDESPWDTDEQRQAIARSLPLKVLFNSHKASWIRGVYEASLETAVTLAAILLHISLGPYHEDVEQWKPRRILPPQFCSRYHRRILKPVYDKYATLRSMTATTAQKIFVKTTFQLPRTAYFRCTADGVIAKHQAMLGLNREHIIKADPKTLKPMSIWPWEEIDDDGGYRKGVWSWDELRSWQQHGDTITMDLPDIGRFELKSDYANEIAIHLHTWTLTKKVGQQKREQEGDSESDTLGSWENMDDDEPKASVSMFINTKEMPAGLKDPTATIDISSDSPYESSDEEFVLVAEDNSQIKEITEGDIIEFTPFV